VRRDGDLRPARDLAFDSGRDRVHQLLSLYYSVKPGIMSVQYR
jgi:hypothetical protein